MSAVEGLRDSLVENAKEERALANDLDKVRRDRHRGRSWRQITVEGSGQSALAHLGSVLARLSRAGGAFRKALASALVSEGESPSGIARLFGVSRQRIYNLVHRSRE
jgi:hypothetical protein